MNPQICPSAYDPKRNGESETASKLIENRIKHMTEREREMSQQVEGTLCLCHTYTQRKLDTKMTNPFPKVLEQKYQKHQQLAMTLLREDQQDKAVCTH